MMNRKVLGLFFLSILSFLILSPSVSKAQSAVKLDYSWREFNYNTSITKHYGSESFILEESGTVEDSFNYSYGYAVSDSEWVEEESIFSYNSTYNYFSNTTITGDYTLELDFTVYCVDISYGKAVQILWFALKEGTTHAIFDFSRIKEQFRNSNNFSKRTDVTYRKYNSDNGTLLDTWQDSFTDEGKWDKNANTAITEYSLFQELDMNYTMPLVLSYQVFETATKDKLAWAELFSDYYVYEDIDKNRIYSVGETKYGSSQFHLTASDEYRGFFVPWASEVKLKTEFIQEGEPAIIQNEVHNFPGDLSHRELAKGIEFTEPTLNGEMVEWNIRYPDYPIWGFVQREDEYFASGWENEYAYTSPGDFEYGFQFGVEDNMGYLDLTSEIPRMSNSSLFDLVQGLSLAVPHYTYFLSSANLEKEVNQVLTLPSNLFQFEIDGTKVAEISMEEDRKRFYSLMDYPKWGENRTYTSLGSTVSGLITSNLFVNPHADRNWFLDSIFALKDLDIVKQDPVLANPDSLFDIQMQNYPLWSGYEIIHDPRFSFYFNSASDEDITTIPSYYIPIVLGLAVVILYIKKKNLKLSFK
jgi:hypothetical protein